MDLSRALFVVLLSGVAVSRFVELGVSRRHQATLAARGACSAPDPVFPFMVLLHLGILVASGVEVFALRRPFLPILATPMLALVTLATLLRTWVIRTLGTHWNTRIVRSLALGVVAGGPYRWIRHPNYVAVFVELAALPLVHTAWITALAFTFAHVWVLRRRIAAEEVVLSGSAVYRATMAHKPRFLPRIARCART